MPVPPHSTRPGLRGFNWQTFDPEWGPSNEINKTPFLDGQSMVNYYTRSQKITYTPLRTQPIVTTKVKTPTLDGERDLPPGGGDIRPPAMVCCFSTTIWLCSVVDENVGCEVALNGSGTSLKHNTIRYNTIALYCLVNGKFVYSVRIKKLKNNNRDKKN